jgi:hypothetical protein
MSLSSTELDFENTPLPASAQNEFSLNDDNFDISMSTPPPEGTSNGASLQGTSNKTSSLQKTSARNQTGEDLPNIPISRLGKIPKVRPPPIDTHLASTIQPDGGHGKGTIQLTFKSSDVSRFWVYSQGLARFWRDRGPVPGSPPPGYTKWSRECPDAEKLWQPWWKTDGVRPPRGPMVRDTPRPLGRSLPGRSYHPYSRPPPPPRSDANDLSKFAEQFGNMIQQHRNTKTTEKLIELAQRASEDPTFQV